MFTDPLTDLDLYWIGYFRADGSIHRDSARFSQKEQSTVQSLKDYCQAPANVHFTNKVSNYGPNPTYILYLSTKLARCLKDLGVKAELRPDLYDSLHFWRGLVDGDGSLAWQKIGSRRYPYLSCCGVEKDMTLFAEFIAKTLTVTPPKLSFKGNTAYINLSGEKARRMIQTLYEGNYSANEAKRDKAMLMIAWRKSYPGMGWVEKTTSPPT